MVSFKSNFPNYEDAERMAAVYLAASDCRQNAFG